MMTLPLAWIKVKLFVMMIEKNKNKKLWERSEGFAFFGLKRPSTGDDQ